MYLTIR